MNISQFYLILANSGEYAGTQGLGLLRLHSTYRHDLKIYASDEGRVQMTAAAFAKGLLALEVRSAFIIPFPACQDAPVCNPGGPINCSKMLWTGQGTASKGVNLGKRSHSKWGCGEKSKLVLTILAFCLDFLVFILPTDMISDF